MNSSQLPCLPSADSAFGPVVATCRDGFDFTFAFEQYFLSIVPSVAILVVAPIRLYFLRQKPNRVSGNGLKLIKLFTIALFAALQLTLVVLWATTAEVGVQGAPIAAFALSFMTSLLFCALSYMEHSKSLAPSVLLNIYLFLSLLFDAVILRTLWLANFSLIIRDIFTVSFALKGVMLLLEAKEKQKYFSDSDKNLSPEESSGLYSQGLFWWMNTIIKKGFRHLLRPDDLYRMDEAMSSEALNLRFWKLWSQSSRDGKYKLLFVTARLLRWPILLPAIPRLVLIGFTFCQPLLINRFLNYLLGDVGYDDAKIGYGLVAAYGLVYFGMAVSNAYYSHRAARCVAMTRATLVAVIFSKTTEISITSLDNSAAITLMSTDVESIVKNLREIHELWANIIQMALATWLLELETGVACIAPLAVVVVSTGLTIYLAGFMKKSQVDWIAKIQIRVGTTSTTLGSMKGIKMSGLTQKMSEIIRDLRLTEIRTAKKFRLLSVYGATLAQVPAMLSPVITFVLYNIIAVRSNRTLDVSKLFTSLSLIMLLTQPLFYLFLSIVQLVSSVGCFERIGTFLAKESKADHRLILPATFINGSSQPRGSVNSDAENGSSEDIELLDMNPISFTQNETYSRPIDKIFVAADKTPAIIIRSGEFGWRNGESILKDINLTILRSNLTVLVGPVASGKSTLLKSLLGETLSSKGFVHIFSKEIAWCEQIPWLVNSSVRENIIGFSNFDINLYNATIAACDLRQDIDLFPNGDETNIGSKGITLSGGQKQRMAIARAVYSKKKIAVFDDVFSGLDSATEKKVFERLFGNQGLLRRWGTTVILATHAVNLLPFADQIIVLDNGTISEQGTFNELNAAKGYIYNFNLEHAKDSLSENRSMELNTEEKSVAHHKQIKNEQQESLIGNGRQLGDLSVYRYFFDTIGWKYASIFVILEIFWAFFTTFPNVWLKWWADANETSPNQKNGFYLGVYSALQVAGLLSHAALIWFCLNVMVVKSGTRLHDITLKTVMSAPLAFFTATDTGSITTRFSQDLQLIDNQLQIALMCVTAYLFICAAQAVLIASATFYVALSFPGLIVVFYFVQKCYLRTSRQLRLLDLEEKAPVYTQFIETLSGLCTIRAFSWREPSIAYNHTLIARSQKPFYLLLVIQRWLTLVVDLITTALAILIVVISVKLRESHSSAAISVGFTGVALTQIISFTANVKLLIAFWTQMETSIGAVARIKSFSEGTADENFRPEGSGEVSEPSAGWARRGRIVFDNVTAAYDNDSERKALDSISLAIEPGQRIGICGRTGSGKTSLLLSLFRLLDLSSGSITVDDMDISSLPPEAIRTRLNVISQEPFFLPGNVRLNLDPYGHSTEAGAGAEAADDAVLITALEKVGLWTTIASKGGLDTDMDNSADGLLSQGQKQLFCLARAVVRAARTSSIRTGGGERGGSGILVLDEVSSSVDPGTDQLMQRVIREEFARSTILAVAHRIETILDFDAVVVMHEGRVVECGPPGELARKGVFERLMERATS